MRRTNKRQREALAEDRLLAVHKKGTCSFSRVSETVTKH